MSPDGGCEGEMGGAPTASAGFSVGPDASCQCPLLSPQPIPTDDLYRGSIMETGFSQGLHMFPERDGIGNS